LHLASRCQFTTEYGWLQKKIQFLQYFDNIPIIFDTKERLSGTRAERDCKRCFGINSIENGWIETSVDNDCRGHKIFSVCEAEPEPLSRVTLHDTACVDFVVETQKILAVGEFIEIYEASGSCRTAVVLWISSPLAGCSFITAQPLNLVKFWQEQPERTSLKGPSVGVRIWKIFGSALLLWGVIGGLAFWLSV
jgi:hypothetical protein